MSFHGDSSDIAKRIFSAPFGSQHGHVGNDVDASYNGKLGKTICIRDVIMDPGDDEEFDPTDFEDTRLELQNLGHNLVRKVSL